MSLSFDYLSETPAFVGALRFLAGELRTRFDGNPRLSRLLASHQKWLLSHTAFALGVEYDPALPETGLTTTRLKEKILPLGAASRNTVLNFLDQLVSYRFLRIAGDPNRRPRRFEATEVTVEAMSGWLLLNLAALDTLDGAGRAAVYRAHPELLRLVQPRVAYGCLNDIRWREPPPRVATFLWTEAGGLVMDNLICRTPPDYSMDKPIDIGRIDAKAMAEQFMMSRTHLQRMLRKAIDLGCLSWQDPGERGALWLNPDYLAEYCRWQAVKSSILDEAFQAACAARGIAFEGVPAPQPWSSAASAARG